MLSIYRRLLLSLIHWRIVSGTISDAEFNSYNWLKSVPVFRCLSSVQFPSSVASALCHEPITVRHRTTMRVTLERDGKKTKCWSVQERCMGPMFPDNEIRTLKVSERKMQLPRCRLILLNETKRIADELYNILHSLDSIKFSFSHHRSPRQWHKL